ncbi:hypothetical protein E3P92_01650 [Wallemia ichthyophaga]|nr:hypothetical protein E3P92_01650 [Wallemia ichthyophaga]
MADCDARCDDEYSSLLNQLYLSLAIGGSSLILFETFLRLKRRDMPTGDDQYRSEKYIFGYLYRFKSFLDPPSAAHPKWPLKWIIQVMMLGNEEIIRKLGGDAAAYIHWLRVCLCFTLSQTLTMVPILLPIHFHFSSSGASSSMNTASLTHLIENESGERLIYVHVILYIYTSISWLVALLWLINGTISIREKLAYMSADNAEQEEQQAQTQAHKSKSILVTNIPTRLRDERILASYFAFYLNRFKKKKTTVSRRSSIASFTSFIERLDGGSGGLDVDAEGGSSRRSYHSHHSHHSHINNHINNTDHLEDITDAHIEDVCIVRKYDSLVQLRRKHADCTKRLELAYMGLAKRVLAHVERRLSQVNGEGWSGEDEVLVQELAGFVRKQGVSQATCTSRISQAVRGALNKLLRREDSFVRFTDSPDSDKTRAYTPTHNTIWDALLLLPSHTLEPFQSRIRVKPLIQSVVRGARGARGARPESTIPDIHYLTHKLRLLTKSVEQVQMETPAVFPPTSTAFVTFRGVADARIACRKLASHPTRPHACIVAPAPFYSEIEWDVAISSQSKSLTLRALIIKIGVWGFILFYIIPMAALSSLFSIERVRNVSERLGRYFDRHERQAEWFTTILPTLIVAFISLMMPAILFGIGKKATPHLTLGRMHDQIFHRYWVFMITNVLITFCIGAATFRFILESLSGSASGMSILNRVYLSFPQAAPFFASWSILQTSIQNLVQLALIGLPLLTFFLVTLRAQTPRQRQAATNARTPDYHVFCSNTLLVVSVCLVMGVFNPLVIPFTLVYFIAANIVYRNQLYHVYSRRVYDTGGRRIAVRCFRYGMDALSVSQTAFFAFHLVRYEDGKQADARTYAVIIGVLFALTQLAKLLITRQVKARFDALELLDALWRNGESLASTQVQSLSGMTLEMRYAEHVEETRSSRALTGEKGSGDARWSYKLRNFLLCSHFTPSALLRDLRKETRGRLSNLRRKCVPIVSRSKKIPKEILAQGGRDRGERVGGQSELDSDTAELGEVLHVDETPQAPLFNSQMRSDSHIFTALSVDNLNKASNEDSGYGNVNGNGPSNTNSNSNKDNTPTQTNKGIKLIHKLNPIKNISAKLDTRNNRIDKVGLTEVESGEEGREMQVVKHVRRALRSDAPDESTRYHCPFYYENLQPFLLLPRDPRRNIDLDDLVELHYGGGSVGWMEREDEAEEDSGLDSNSNGSISSHATSITTASSTSTTNYEHISLSNMHRTHTSHSARYSQTFRDSLSPKLGRRWMESEDELFT